MVANVIWYLGKSAILTNEAIYKFERNVIETNEKSSG